MQKYNMHNSIHKDHHSKCDFILKNHDKYDIHCIHVKVHPLSNHYYSRRSYSHKGDACIYRNKRNSWTYSYKRGDDLLHNYTFISHDLCEHSDEEKVRKVTGCPSILYVPTIEIRTVRKKPKTIIQNNTLTLTTSRISIHTMLMPAETKIETSAFPVYVTRSKIRNQIITTCLTSFVTQTPETITRIDTSIQTVPTIHQIVSTTVSTTTKYKSKTLVGQLTKFVPLYITKYDTVVSTSTALQTQVSTTIQTCTQVTTTTCSPKPLTLTKTETFQKFITLERLPSIITKHLTTTQFQKKNIWRTETISLTSEKTCTETKTTTVSETVSIPPTTLIKTRKCLKILPLSYKITTNFTIFHTLVKTSYATSSTTQTVTAKASTVSYPVIFSIPTYKTKTKTLTLTSVLEKTKTLPPMSVTYPVLIKETVFAPTTVFSTMNVTQTHTVGMSGIYKKNSENPTNSFQIPSVKYGTISNMNVQDDTKSIETPYHNENLTQNDPYTLFHSLNSTLVSSCTASTITKTIKEKCTPSFSVNTTSLIVKEEQHETHAGAITEIPKIIAETQCNVRNHTSQLSSPDPDIPEKKTKTVKEVVTNTITRVRYSTVTGNECICTH